MSAGREIPVPGYLAGKPPAFFEGIAKRYEARYKADKEATTLLKKWDAMPDTPTRPAPGRSTPACSAAT